MVDKKIYHNAYFWLDNPKNLNEKEYFLVCLKKMLNLSSFVQESSVSQSLKIDKGVIESNYTFSLMIVFGDEKQQELYEEEDVYKEFVNEVGHLWRKVQVFNSEEIWNAVLKPETV